MTTHALNLEGIQSTAIFLVTAIQCIIQDFTTGYWQLPEPETTLWTIKGLILSTPFKE